ncbi:hypothetical protein ABW20_dc0109758 [Dactylellina cionopaga]|nr:hypothetical protein ABW20_dc0109758 [Dactylellina cionopaga]
MVWDARVVCQKPKVSNYQVLTPDGEIVTDQFIGGKIRASVSLDIIEKSQPESTDFFCTIPGTDTSKRPVICELSIPRSPSLPPGYQGLNFSGGLKSEFSAPENKVRGGRAYLVMNNTGLSEIPKEYLNNNPEWENIGSTPGQRYQAGGIILASLCYTAMDAVDRNVEISSPQPLTESTFSSYTPLHEIPNVNNISVGPTVPSTIQVGNYYQFDKALSQLIAGNATKPEVRGILSLKQPQSGWAEKASLEAESDGPWILNISDPNSSEKDGEHPILTALELYQTDSLLSDTGYLISETSSKGNSSVFFNEKTGLAENKYRLNGNPWIGDLYLAVKDHPKGNSALALQAIFSVLFSNAYYEYIQKFDRFDNISTVVFQNVSSPGGLYGTRRGSFNDQEGGFNNFPVGYAIVAVVLVVHTILAFIIFIRFITGTVLTRLGDPWQALAQVASRDFEGIENLLDLSRKLHADRTTVSKELETIHENGVHVGMEHYNGSVKLTRKDTNTT